MPPHPDWQESIQSKFGTETMGRTFTDRFGTMNVVKGNNGKYSLFSWEAVPHCRGGFCSSAEYCPYEYQAIVRRNGQCKVLTNYMSSITLLIMRNYQDMLDEGLLYRIGMHLMPLYLMLGKFKIRELAVVNPIVTSEKGMIRAHPLYKEIRETIKAIESMWRDLGFSGVQIINPEIGETTEIGMAGGTTQDGLTYYDRMEQSAVGQISETEGAETVKPKASLRLRKR